MNLSKHKKPDFSKPPKPTTSPMTPTFKRSLNYHEADICSIPYFSLQRWTKARIPRGRNPESNREAVVVTIRRKRIKTFIRFSKRHLVPQTVGCSVAPWKRGFVERSNVNLPTICQSFSRNKSWIFIGGPSPRGPCARQCGPNLRNLSHLSRLPRFISHGVSHFQASSNAERIEARVPVSLFSLSSRGRGWKRRSARRGEIYRSCGLLPGLYGSGAAAAREPR